METMEKAWRSSRRHGDQAKDIVTLPLGELNPDIVKKIGAQLETHLGQNAKKIVEIFGK